MRRAHRTTERTRSAASRLLASFAAALTIVACNTVAGLDELTFTAGSAGAGGSPQGGGGGSAGCEPKGGADGCARCTYDECPADYCDCMADDNCVLLYDCLIDCELPDTTCQRNCIQAYPERISQASLLADCSSVHCLSCPTSLVLSGCEECLFRQCAEGMNECVADDGCLDYLICFVDCVGDTSCIEACAVTHSVATTLFLSVYTCAQIACTLPCG